WSARKDTSRRDRHWSAVLIGQRRTTQPPRRSQPRTSGPRRPPQRRGLSHRCHRVRIGRRFRVVTRSFWRHPRVGSARSASSHERDTASMAGAPRERTDPIPLGAPSTRSGHTERADAARNRRKILAAAERLVATEGFDALTMDRVAQAAGVGVGTVYRRFTDLAGLAQAMLDEKDLELQEGFLRGDPPLGPGAPPAERLHAFLDAMLTRV